MPKSTVIADGSFDFSGGVNSQAVTTIQSALVPHGIRRDQLSWLSNATVRGGGITQRSAWFKLLDLLTSGLFQGGIVYETFDQSSNPRLVVSVSGVIYSILLDPPYTVTNLSAAHGNLRGSATAPEAFFCEAEGYLIIQAGDYFLVPVPTLPIIYRTSFTSVVGGVPTFHPEAMKRSNGINGVLPPVAIGLRNTLQEIPAATAMVYYQGRLCYAQGRIYTAGDMVGDTASGEPVVQYRDCVTRVTENPLATGGDGFAVPSQAGNITALAYTANLDTTLGQGPLYIFTRKQVYTCNLPVTRSAWIAAGAAGAVGPDGQPIQTVAQINNGAVGDRCVTHVNGDLFYKDFTPSIRSLFIATRFFNEWGNTGISNNEARALGFENRALTGATSAIQFDNRLLVTTQPAQTASGIISAGIIPLDFDLVSTLDERNPPAWEGMWQGLSILQLFTGDFGGFPRAFAVVVNKLDQSLDVWEISQGNQFESDGVQTDKRVGWAAEFPAFTWGKEFELKELAGGEIWLDRIVGTVNVEVYYRPDAQTCWNFWHRTSVCAAHNCAEDVNTPTCYPYPMPFGEGYAFPLTLPAPPLPPCQTNKSRPANLGFQHQAKVVLTGFCRIRGIMLYASIKERQLYEGLSC